MFAMPHLLRLAPVLRAYQQWLYGLCDCTGRTKRPLQAKSSRVVIWSRLKQALNNFNETSPIKIRWWCHSDTKGEEQEPMVLFHSRYHQHSTSITWYTWQKMFSFQQIYKESGVIILVLRELGSIRGVGGGYEIIKTSLRGHKIVMPVLRAMEFHQLFLGVRYVWNGFQ